MSVVKAICNRIALKVTPVYFAESAIYRKIMLKIITIFASLAIQHITRSFCFICLSQSIYYFITAYIGNQRIH